MRSVVYSLSLGEPACSSDNGFGCFPLLWWTQLIYLQSRKIISFLDALIIILPWQGEIDSNFSPDLKQQGGCSLYSVMRKKSCFTESVLFWAHLLSDSQCYFYRFPVRQVKQNLVYKHQIQNFQFIKKCIIFK